MTSSFPTSTPASMITMAFSHVVVNPNKFATISTLSNFNEQFTIKKWTENQTSQHDMEESKKECIGTIKFKLYDDTAPLACERFRRLASGIDGFGYKGTQLHRIIPGCIIQGGIVTLTDEKGDLYLYEKVFPGKLPLRIIFYLTFCKIDEDLTRMHNRKGLLSVVSFGKNTNSTQFFITLNPLPWLNGFQEVFGSRLASCKQPFLTYSFAPPQVKSPISTVCVPYRKSKNLDQKTVSLK